MGLFSFAFEVGGAICGKIASLNGLVDGFTKGFFTTMEPKVLGKAMNNGGVFFTQVLQHYDPKLVATIIKQNPDFCNSLMQELQK